MAFRVPESVIAEVRERTDIVRVVEQYVTLKRSGANHVGLCPFHEEKTGSFVVSPQRRTFYCFGCQERGDVYDFVRKMEGKSFPEVLEELARQAGVELPRVDVSPGELVDRKRRKDEREQCLKVNEIAAAFYRRELQGPRGESARRYLRLRGVDSELAERFGLGCAPAAWDGLTSHLARKQVPAYLAVRLGLVVPTRGRSGGSENRGRNSKGTALAVSTHHDFFRDRVMFPVTGPGGEVIAFSGRLLDPEAEQRKYVNSPESPVYRKAEALYGLHAARRAMRKQKSAVLVEGNLDVLALHREGFETAVAPLGTALTRSQVNLLRRFVDKVVLMFDGDDAGRAATAKSVMLLLEMDLEGWVAALPSDHDPDSYLAESGPESLSRILGAAQPGADHLIRSVAAEAGDQIPDRVRALRRLAPMLSTIRNPVTRALYVERVAAALEMDREMVEKGIADKSSTSDARSDSRPDGPRGRKTGAGDRKRTVDRRAGEDPGKRHAVALLALLVAHPHLAPAAASEDAASYVEDPDLKRILLMAFELQAETGRVDAWELLRSTQGPASDLLADAVLSERYGAELDAHRALADIVSGLKLAQLSTQLSDLAREIRRAEQEGNQNLLRELALKRHQLSHARNHLIGERA